MIESISDLHCLFVNVHVNNLSLKDGLPNVGAFSNTPKEGDNLSANWCAYCTSQSAREMIGKQFRISDGKPKVPANFFIWRFLVSSLRYKVESKQIVIHHPTRSNYSHSKIKGEKPTNVSEFRVQMLKAGLWAIAPSLK